MRILPPAGIVRTMQANNDLSSRSAVSDVFPIAGAFVCPVEANNSGKTAPAALLIVVSMTLTEGIEVSGFDRLVVEIGCSVVKTCPSKP